MTRKHKIRAISGVFAIFAIGMGILALRPLFRVTKIFVTHSKHSNSAKADAFDTVDIAMYDAKDRKINVSASQISKDKNEDAVLKQMTSRFSLENGDICNVVADVARTINKELIDFKRNVQLHTESGLSLYTDHALADLSKKTVSGTTHVVIKKGDGEISGNDYFIDLSKKHLVIKRNAKLHNATENIESNQFIATLKDDNQVDNADAYGDVKYSSVQHIINGEKISLHGDVLKISKNVHIIEKAKNEHVYGDNALIYLDNSRKVKSAEISGSARYISRERILQANKIIYNNNTLKAQNNVILDYQQNNQKYRITTSSLMANIVNGNICQIKTDNKLIIKSNNDTIRANSGVVRNNKLFLYGDVSASGETGSVLGNEAVLDLSTGDIDIKNSRGIVEEGRNVK